MRTIVTLLLAVVLLGSALILSNRAPEAVIKIEALSPQDLVDLELDLPTTNGLDVVGVGEMVILWGEDDSGGEVFLYTWSMEEAPPGSNVAPASLFEQRFTFRPDVPGQYTVRLTIATGSGTSIDSVVITAATYVGVGSVAGATPNPAEGQCAACHTGNTAGYFDTKHASKFERDLDTRTYYPESCLGCHTVGYNTDTQAVNGGFDDIAADLGWTIPDPVGVPGNWESLVTNFPDLAQVSNIQCENCHGPGSEHMGDKTKIDVSVSEDVCAKCHDALTHHPKGTQWQNAAHSEGVSSAAGRSTQQGRTGYPAADGFSCNGCHSTYGFIARTDPASDLRDENGEPLVTGMPALTCAGCHDPHGKENEHQLRRVENVTLEDGYEITKGGLGRFCMTCHHARTGAEDYLSEPHSRFSGSHYNAQADMLFGRNAVTFGRTLPNSTHKDVLEDTCVSCHMYETPAEGEPGHNQVGEHSFNVSFTTESGETIDNVARCRTCHEPDMETFDDRMSRFDYDEDGVIEGAQNEVRGLMDIVGMLLPPIGEPEFDRRAERTPLQAKGAWNYRLVDYDQSMGVHNFQFAVNLLLLTRDALTYGVLTEGVITGVTDVSNDQGRQVNVSWTRFGGDGPSDNPVEVYYVWRNDGEGTLASKREADYATLIDVPVSYEISTASVMFGGAMWTQVGTTPAAMMEAYNAIVPTLNDSTGSGMATAEFMVTGHTATSTVFATTDVVSGYSVDNLVPSAPTGFVAMGSDTAVMLQWEESVDADFDYFELYKSTVEGFDPSGMDPIAVLTETQYIDQAVTTGSMYSYLLVAYDFSGNRGVFTPEISATATAVELLGDVPRQFTLSQNYPNPFNPTTTIEFAIPEPGDVTIKIYDVSGKQVGVLVNEHMQPGTYSKEWNAQNLASGVYIYKMVSGSFVHTNTMLLIK